MTIPDYIEMIRLKTAVLLGASLKIGALIAGAKRKMRKSFIHLEKILVSHFN